LKLKNKPKDTINKNEQKLILKDNKQEKDDIKTIISSRKFIPNEPVVSSRDKQRINDENVDNSVKIGLKETSINKIDKEILNQEKEIDKDNVIPSYVDEKIQEKLNSDEINAKKEVSIQDTKNDLIENKEKADYNISLIRNSQLNRNSNSKVVAPNDLMTMKDTKYLKNTESALKETIKTFIAKNIKIVKRIIK
jgi:hypothetical protein